MAVQCPPELFELFEKSCGDWVAPDENIKDFLYVAQAESDCEGHCLVNFPLLRKAIFCDWELFERWCEKVSGDLYEELLKKEGIELYEIFEDNFTKLPNDVFSSREVLIRKIVAVLIEFQECDASVVRVLCGEKELYLVFVSSKGWGLGSTSSVFVMRTMKELSRKNNFYSV